MAGRDGRDIRVPAPFVIAADGRRSALAVPLGLTSQPKRPRRWAIGGYFAGVQGLQPFGEMHVRRGKYIGVAPVPGGLANVCVVVPEPRGMGDPGAVLEDAVAQDSALRDRFAGAALIDRPTVLGPLAVDARDAGMDGLLLAGDAVGFIDPMTGDGLRFAVRGGELAAQAVLATMEEKITRPHVALREQREREFAAKWRFIARGLVSVCRDRTRGGRVRRAGAAAAHDRFAGDVDIPRHQGGRERCVHPAPPARRARVRADADRGAIRRGTPRCARGARSSRGRLYRWRWPTPARSSR